MKYDETTFGVLSEEAPKTGQDVQFSWGKNAVKGFVEKVIESRDARKQKKIWSKIKIRTK